MDLSFLIRPGALTVNSQAVWEACSSHRPCTSRRRQPDCPVAHGSRTTGGGMSAAVPSEGCCPGSAARIGPSTPPWRARRLPRWTGRCASCRASRTSPSRGSWPPGHWQCSVGPPGRRAASTGVAAISAASFVVNQPVKYLGGRLRPDREGHAVRRGGYTDADVDVVPLRHSASAAAFAVAVGDVVPALRVPLTAAAGTVAFSRVYTGVHYPGDVLVGVARGAILGRLASRLRAPGQPLTKGARSALGRPDRVEVRRDGLVAPLVLEAAHGLVGGGGEVTAGLLPRCGSSPRGRRCCRPRPGAWRPRRSPPESAAGAAP